MLAMRQECIWTSKDDICYNQIVLMEEFITNRLQVQTLILLKQYQKFFLVEKEKGEVILNEDYNNKQKERVRRDFKDKIHHHGMKKEDARESLRFGQIYQIVHLGQLRLDSPVWAIQIRILRTWSFTRPHNPSGLF